MGSLSGSLSAARYFNHSYLKKLGEDINIKTEEGMRKTVVFVEGEAKKLAIERIYSKPSKGYVRTGLYKASLRGYCLGREGYQTKGKIESKVEYAKALEYKHQKMILNDAVYKNHRKIMRILHSEVKK